MIPERRVRTPDEDTVRRIRVLCELGARTPMLEGLFPAITASILTQYRDNIVGERSSRGPGPCGISWFFDRAARRLESSYAARIYLELEAAGMHSIDALIVAFQEYLLVTKSKPIDDGFMNLERLWLLVKMLRGGSIVLLKCPHCKGQYLHDRNYLVDHQKSCPVHRHYNLVAKPPPRLRSQPARQNYGSALTHADLAIVPPSLSRFVKTPPVITITTAVVVEPYVKSDLASPVSVIKKLS